MKGEHSLLPKVPIVFRVALIRRRLCIVIQVAVYFLPGREHLSTIGSSRVVSGSCAAQLIISGPLCPRR